MLIYMFKNGYLYIRLLDYILHVFKDALHRCILCIKIYYIIIYFLFNFCYVVLQHEVENSVFEQLSCSRFEHFWLEW